MNTGLVPVLRSSEDRRCTLVIGLAVQMVETDGESGGYKWPLVDYLC